MNMATKRRMAKLHYWLREKWQDAMEDWEANFIVLALVGCCLVGYLGST